MRIIKTLNNLIEIKKILRQVWGYCGSGLNGNIRVFSNAYGKLIFCWGLVKRIFTASQENRPFKVGKNGLDQMLDAANSSLPKGSAPLVFGVYKPMPISQHFRLMRKGIIKPPRFIQVAILFLKMLIEIKTNFKKRLVSWLRRKTKSLGKVNDENI